jgi:hypothetical protein
MAATATAMRTTTTPAAAATRRRQLAPFCRGARANRSTHCRNAVHNVDRYGRGRVDAQHSGRTNYVTFVAVCQTNNKRAYAGSVASSLLSSSIAIDVPSSSSSSSCSSQRTKNERREFRRRSLGTKPANKRSVSTHFQRLVGLIAEHERAISEQQQHR